MATKDFRASQVRLTQIIGSGSESGKPSVLIVSAADSSGYEGEALSNSVLLANVGTDVFMFVTGSKNTRTDVTLFGGDVVISGTMYAERQVVEVDLSATGSLSISGSLIVSQSATIHEGLIVNESRETGAENDFSVYASTTKALFVDATGNAAGAIALATDKGSSETITVTNTQGTTDGSDDAGAIELSAAAGGIGLAWADSKTLWAEGGDVMIVANENKSDAIKLHADAGSSQTISVINDEGTSESAIKIEAGAGGVDIDAAAGKNVTINGGQVLILSGGGVSSFNEAAGVDVAFYVSGSQGSKGSSTKGTAVFGGDTVISGTLYADDLTITDDVDVGDELTVRGELIVSQYVSHLSDSNTRIDFDDNEVKIEADGSVVIHLDGESGQKSININNNANDVDFIVYADALGKQLVKGIAQSGNEQVLILSGGSGHSADQSSGEDIAFFVSGTSGGKDSTGVAVFGGDVVISGSIWGELESGSKKILDFTADQLRFQNRNGRATSTGDDTNFYISGSKGSKNSATDRGTAVFGGDVVVSGTLYDGNGNPISGGGSATGSFNVPSAGEFVTTASLSVAGGLGFNHTADTTGADTFFFVSGSIGQKGATTGKTAVLGGDAVVSGTLYAENAIHVTAITSSLADDTNMHLGDNSGTGYILFNVDGSEKVRITNSNGLAVQNTVSRIGDSNTKIHFSDDKISLETGGKTGLVLSESDGDHSDIIYLGGPSTQFNRWDQVLILSGGSGHSPDESSYTDVAFFVSGAVGGKGGDDHNVSLFGGDVVVSGAMYLEETSAPGVIPDGAVVLYGKDDSGVTKLYFKNESGEVEVGSGGGGTVTTGSFNVPGQGAFVTTASLSLAGGEGFTHTAFSEGSDLYFFVSGSKGKKGVIDSAAVSAFGGDVVISGTLYGGVSSVIEGTHLAHRADVNIIQGGSIPLTIGADVSTFISGAIDWKGTENARGTTVVGGDLLSSGTLFIDNSSQTISEHRGIKFINDNSDSNAYFHINLRSDDNPAGTGGPNAVNIQNRGAGSVMIGLGTGSLAENPASFLVTEMAMPFSGSGFGGANRSFLMTSASHGGQVYILSGGAPTSVDPKHFTDTSFFVSGTIGSKGGSEGGVAVFGGDAVVSGNLYATEYIYHAGDDDTRIRFGTNEFSVLAGNKGVVAGLSSVVYLGSAGTAASKNDKVLILSGGGVSSPSENDFTDLAFFVSGGNWI